MSQQLNLYNPLFLRQKKYFSSRTMLRTLAVLLVAFVLVNVIQRIQLAGLEKQQVEAATQLESTRQQLVKFAQDAKRPPSKVLEDLETRLQMQTRAQEVLLDGLKSGELGNVQGFSPYLVALARQTMSGVWLTGFSATGEGPQMIRGRMLRAEMLPSYLRMLNKEDALRGQGFAQLQLTTREEKDDSDSSGTSYVEFSLGERKTAEEIASANAKVKAQDERDEIILNKMRMALRGGR
ncbi:MAG TPA: hypothetical protein VJU83_03585 [Burkholderiales bacterium]|nr:hypothetical protein [Burkholderiales bacterium]